MDKLLIRGGRTLHGEVLISGAKNAALPELCAALLTSEPVVLRNVPRLEDVSTMLKLVRNMGVQATRADDGTVQLDASTLTNPEAPYELVKTMRASVLALGPLLARFGRAKVSLPGGCAIGSRPVDQHIKGLQAMGAEIVVEHGYMVAQLPQGRSRLKGARIATDMVTVTGTENFLMAAALAEGETVLENAAQEPGIPDLAEMHLQLRDVDPAVLDRLDADIRRITVEAGPTCRATLEMTARTEPSIMAEPLRNALATAAGRLAPGGWTMMPSGAGHDAQILAGVMPAGMLFVPSIGGISHHWTEDTAETDIILGCETLAEACRSLLDPNR